MNKNLLYRSIPKVDILLADEGIKVLIETYSRESVMEAIHSEMEKLRAFIGVCEEEEKAKQQIALLNENIAKAVSAMHTPNMKKVINGTGTILHTNLGRAPISFGHMMRAAEIVSGYSNLEYNLEAGRRGERYSHFEKLLCKLTGAEAAMAVNNNASSVLLILSSLAKGGEVIVSRGELIEIGGKFRIPDVMEQSGANLVEVGTTNKTHYEDYEEAITEETKALLKVHTSNYRIVGFTESVGIDELVPIAKEHGIPVVEDLGSGVLINLEKYGLTHEPTVQESIAHGADVVCFSGDKLLGGPQAGIIIGKKKYIDMMGGTIEAESDLGKGTRFTVVLEHRIADKVYYEQNAEKSSDNNEKRDVLQGKHVLLAEDNDLNAEIAEFILEDMGLVVDRVEDGIRCVARMEQKPAGTYDLILMDIQMPHMDGYKATQAIRRLADQKKADIPIIAMTANAFEEDRKKALEKGMNGHIAKPVDIEKVRKILQNTFKQ